MSRFTKYRSAFLRSRKHQTLKDGDSILFRDWVTIGSQHNFGVGKRPYFNDGNFIFTRSTIPNYTKKSKNGTTIGTYTYDNVKDAKEVINKIDLNVPTMDIRFYCYYGSCVEMVRVAIENIILKFPGQMTTVEEKLYYFEPKVGGEEGDGEFVYLDGKLLSNPFAINLHVKDPVLSSDANKMRYFATSWEEYEINGKPIKSWTPSEWLGDIRCPKNDLLENRKSWVVSVEISDGELSYDLRGYKLESGIHFLCYLREEKAKPDGSKEIVWTPADVTIKPKDSVIEEYFNGLDGFERQLLNRSSYPLYSNKFITPVVEDYFVQSNNKLTYTFPSIGYCIDITSPSYSSFISSVFDLADTLDSIWSDNLYQRMTHESIKNYDYLYSSDAEADEEVFVGKERMKKTLNVVGRVFDDVKRSADVIKLSNRITYDNDRNVPTALVSDKLELQGWDVFSTIPQYSDFDVANTTLKETSFKLPYYNTKTKDAIDFTSVDIEFMKRLFLSSRRIFSTKGTKEGIEMVLGMFGYGEEDFTMTEKYHYFKPRPYDEKLSAGMRGLEETFGDRIVRLNDEKTEIKSYTNEISGIPIGTFKLQELKTDGGKQYYEHKTYIIPLYDQRLRYDGNFYFQSKGKWVEETVSYLKVVDSVSSLLNLHPLAINNGDVFYVSSLHDYINYSENTRALHSNFFVIENRILVDEFSAWRSIDMEDDTDPYYEKAHYLNNLVNSSVGNNPHVGFGFYDEGKDYLDYMGLPFKYSIENELIPNYEDIEDAKTISFDIKTITTEDYSEKVQFVFGNPNRVHCIPVDGITPLYGSFDKKKEQLYLKEKHFLNSKVIELRFNNDNEHFKRYFKDVISKYLLQVIPSTAILSITFEQE